MKKLTKKEALLLIPAVVDNEATSEERIAFFNFADAHPDVKSEYDDALLIKKLLSRKLPRAKAPDQLRDNVIRLIENAELHSDYQDLPQTSSIQDTEHNVKGQIKSDSSSVRTLFRYLAAAAAILFITLTTIELLDRMNYQFSSDIDTLVVETHSAMHFINAGGQYPNPDIRIASTIEAESYLRDHHGINMVIPLISGAEFEGIILSDFVEGFTTPLLKYVQNDIDETIYLFAFDIDQVLTHKSLIRHGEAVEHCETNTDFYVAEIEGHHVVSWLWDNNWYTAVSNHNGYDLASLVEPLNYTP